VGRLRIDDCPFVELGFLECSNMAVADIEKSDESQIVDPVYSIDTKDFHCVDFAPKQAFESESAGQGIWVGVDNDGQSITSTRNGPQFTNFFNHRNGFMERCLHDFLLAVDPAEVY